MNLEKIKSLNSHIEIKGVREECFRQYGRIIDEYDFSILVKYMEDNTSIPEDGNEYIASETKMEQFEISQKIKNQFYGEMDIEIGYCNGKNSSLNGLEYHKCSEINVAATDLVLLLGKVQDIENNTYNSDKVEAFFVPKGTAVELYATTLHFSPCKLTEKGFKCVVVLTKGTNLPLSQNEKIGKEGELLFAKNKWLLVHQERKVLVEKGAHVGITGDNIKIKY